MTRKIFQHRPVEKNFPLLKGAAPAVSLALRTNCADEITPVAFHLNRLASCVFDSLTNKVVDLNTFEKLMTSAAKIKTHIGCHRKLRDDPVERLI